MKERLVSVLLSLALALFAVSGAIAVPILCRPFYYAHIERLELSERTGWSEDVIRGAYDGVMDYMFKGAEFSTGELKWSESGRSHFADVRVLFRLDVALCAASAAALIILLLLSRRIKPHRFLRFGPSFWAGAGLLAVFAVIGIAGAADFERAFVAFHSLFFPGKTNWVFDPVEDPIIYFLPQTYFRNCAILAIVMIAVLVAVYLAAGRRKKKEEARPTAVSASP